MVFVETVQLENIEEDGENRGKTPDREKSADRQLHAKATEHRRGSHLLAAAGIDFERRRKSHQSSGDPRILQDGNDILMQGKDGKFTKMEILEVNEKMGMLRKAVPTLPLCIAILLCITNTFLPGIGTLIGAATLLCCGRSRHENTLTGVKYGILAAVIQIVTTVVIIGWIYSIIYGVNMIQDSITRSSISPEKEEEEAQKSDPKQSSQAWA